MTDPAHVVAVAKRLFAAIESGDVDAVRDLFTEDARIWHNVDGIEQTRDENLRTLAWVVENLADRRYGDVTCQPTPTGFVQQHVLRATGANGSAVELPACIVAVVDGDRIARIDEYLDSAHVARLAAP